MGKPKGIKCPKCGSYFGYKNIDGDYECICGKIVYAQVPDSAPSHTRLESAYTRRRKSV